MKLNKPNAKRNARFLKLLEPETAHLMKYLTDRVLDTADAEDLYQDTILIAYENFDGLRSKKAFPAWLLSCARTAIARMFRKKANLEYPVDTYGRIDETKILNVRPADNLEESVIRRLDMEQLTRLIASLSFTERNFLSLRYGQEMSYKKIAEILNTTPGYLAVLNHRIIKKLRTLGSESDQASKE